MTGSLARGWTLDMGDYWLGSLLGYFSRSVLFEPIR
ncbi:hypothetical protein HRbin28_00702 [bacterium HR28]|nr:hypothetical protein HRbin28_00702 [bacterium HR28]